MGKEEKANKNYNEEAKAIKLKIFYIFIFLERLDSYNEADGKI